jgi:hypothetical protein
MKTPERALERLRCPFQLNDRSNGKSVERI